MTLPNALTALRGAAAVPVAVLIALGALDAALAVFVAACATDALDGFLARRGHTETELGAALDPLADKMLVVGALAALALRAMAPVALVVAILVRELVAVERRARAGRSLPASTDGKLKTVLQMAAVIALLAARLWPSAELIAAAEALIVAAAALTALSGLRLLVRARKTTAHAA